MAAMPVKKASLAKRTTVILAVFYPFDMSSYI